jgi:hypothetical protein
MLKRIPSWPLFLALELDVFPSETQQVTSKVPDPGAHEAK